MLGKPWISKDRTQQWSKWSWRSRNAGINIWLSVTVTLDNRAKVPEVREADDRLAIHHQWLAISRRHTNSHNHKLRFGCAHSQPKRRLNCGEGIQRQFCSAPGGCHKCRVICKLTIGQPEEQIPAGPAKVESTIQSITKVQANTIHSLLSLKPVRKDSQHIHVEKQRR